MKGPGRMADDLPPFKPESDLPAPDQSSSFAPAADDQPEGESGWRASVPPVESAGSGAQPPAESAPSGTQPSAEAAAGGAPSPADAAVESEPQPPVAEP